MPTKEQLSRLSALENLGDPTNLPIRRAFPVSFYDEDPAGKDRSQGVSMSFNYARAQAFVEVDTLWQIGYTGKETPEIPPEYVENWRNRLTWMIDEGIITREGYLAELSGARTWAKENNLPEPRNLLDIGTEDEFCALKKGDTPNEK